VFLKSMYFFKETDRLKNIAISISSKHFLLSGWNTLLLVTFFEGSSGLFFLGVL